MSKKKVFITKEWLEKEYYSGKTYTQISKELDCSTCRVWQIAKKFNIKSRKPCRKAINLVGKKFGLLTVVGIGYTKKQSNRPKQICMCDCGNKCYVAATRLIQKMTIRCPACSKKHVSNLLSDKYGDIDGNIWCNIKRNAKRRNINFEITKENVWNLYKKQNGRCALSGVPIFFRKRRDKVRTTASVDRIDSKKHYTIDNIQLVHKVVNFMKQSLLDKDFIKWCETICVYQKSIM